MKLVLRASIVWVLLASLGPVAAQTAPYTPSSIVSDDFSAPTLNTVTWGFVDPVGGAAFGLTGTGTSDARFQVDMSDGANRDMWLDGLNGTRLMQAANDVDFEAEVKFDSVPTEGYQYQGILIQAGDDHVIRFEVFSRWDFPFVFVAAVDDAGLPSASKQEFVRNKLGGGVAEIPAYLRVTRVGDNWTLSTSQDGTTFISYPSFEYPIVVTRVGVHTGVVPYRGITPSFTCLVDYFQNNAAPIFAEDALDTEPPMAHAGMSVEAHPGDTVCLDGSGSNDDSTPTEDLGFDWSIVSQPVGSSAVLTGADAISPCLAVDALGEYVVQLIVTDGVLLSSPPETVVISSLNLPPVAVVSEEETLYVGDTVMLDALASDDADGDPLSYAWTLLAAPVGSTTALVGASTATPSLLLDVEGDYDLELVVSDPYSDSEPVLLTIHAADPWKAMAQLLRQTAILLRQAASADFDHRYYRGYLMREVRRTASNVRRCEFDVARARLRFLLQLSDGSGLRGYPDPKVDGSSYRADWITDNPLQLQVYGLLSDALAILE